MKIFCRRILLVAVILMTAATAWTQTPPIDDDALNAFGMSFTAYVMGAMMVAFGQPVPGFTVEEGESGATIIFDNFDLSVMGEENYGYTTISGRMEAFETPSGNATMEADLQLAGGPVKDLQWSVEDYDMNDETSEAVFTIIADGKKYQVKNTDFMM